MFCKPWRTALAALLTYCGENFPTPYGMVCDTLMEHGVSEADIRTFLRECNLTEEDIADLMEDLK